MAITELERDEEDGKGMRAKHKTRSVHLETFTLGRGVLQRLHIDDWRTLVLRMATSLYSAKPHPIG